jgi:hypothetical protein
MATIIQWNGPIPNAPHSYFQGGYTENHILIGSSDRKDSCSITRVIPLLAGYKIKIVARTTKSVYLAETAPHTVRLRIKKI